MYALMSLNRSIDEKNKKMALKFLNSFLNIKTDNLEEITHLIYKAFEKRFDLDNEDIIKKGNILVSFRHFI